MIPWSLAMFSFDLTIVTTQIGRGMEVRTFSGLTNVRFNCLQWLIATPFYERPLMTSSHAMFGGGPFKINLIF